MAERLIEGCEGAPLLRTYSEATMALSVLRDRLDPQLATIEAAAEKAYRSFGSHPDGVHASPNCDKVTMLMRGNLSQLGVSCLQCCVERPSGADWSFHCYLFEPDMNRVIDPTWQQFLPRADEEFPKVLVATPSEMHEFCAQLPTLDRHYCTIWNGGVPHDPL